MNQLNVDLDGSVNFTADRLLKTTAERKLVMRDVWNQTLRGTKLVQGITGRQLISLEIRYANLRLEVGAILHRFGPRLRDLRSRALASHPELKGNMQAWARQVFNETAHKGREFQSKLRPGSPLPVYSQTVTAADIAYLRLYGEFHQPMLERVSETRPDRGIQVVVAGKLYRRHAARVGDFSTERHVSGVLEREDLITAYEEAAKAERPALNASTDLSIESEDPRVQFWNAHIRDVVAHILSAGRADVALKRDPDMILAEKALARRFEDQNGFTGIQSLEDVVNALSESDIFPRDSNVGDIPRYVREALIDELDQFERNAREDKKEMAARQTVTTVSIGDKLNNEFTLPAAKLRYPSTWYEYGAVTDGQITLAAHRALHEPLVDLFTGFDRARTALRAELQQAVQEGKLSERYPGGIQHIEDVLAVLDKLSGQLENLHRLDDPNNRSMHGGQWLPWRLYIGKLLSGVTVFTTNMTAGHMMPLLTSMEIDRSLRSLVLLRTFFRLPQLAVKEAIYAAKGIIRGGSVSIRFMLGEGRRDFEKLVRLTAEEFSKPLSADVTQIRGLGFSNADPFLTSLRQVWRRLYEFQSETEFAKQPTSTVGKVVRFPGKVLRLSGESLALAFNRSLLHFADTWLNTMSIGEAGIKIRDFKHVGLRYVQLRKGLGRFDPSRREWQLDPAEWSNRFFEAEQVQSLAQLRDFLFGADISLEHLLYRIGTEIEAGGPGNLTASETDSLIRAFAREHNAADPILNRPIAATTNKLYRTIFVLRGFMSDFMLKFLGAFSGTHSQAYSTKLLLSLPTMLVLAIGAAVLGLTRQGVNDYWTRHYRKQWSRNASILDDAFWTNFSHAKEAATLGMLSSIAGYGDIALLVTSAVTQSRGYQASQQVVALSLMDKVTTLLKGAWALPAKDFDIVATDFLKGLGGFNKELLNLTSSQVAGKSDYNAAQADWVYGLTQSGMRPAQRAGGGSFNYAPTSGIRQKLQAAVMNGDTAEAQVQADRLVQFYKDKGVPDPRKSALNDFRSGNPVLRAGGGRKPTESEFNMVFGKLGADRQARVSRALSAWKSAEPMFGAAPTVSSVIKRAPGTGTRTRGTRLGRTRIGRRSRSRLERLPRLRLAGGRSRRRKKSLTYV